MEKQALEGSRSQQPEELKRLEECLLQPELRKSPQDLADLLADELIEFGSSGQIFDKPQVIEALQHESTDELSLMDFQARTLAADVVLVMYRAVRRNTLTGQATDSLRSSIWKFLDGRWQMVFHQGTPSANKIS